MQADATTRPPSPLRVGPWERRLRFATGSILATYVLTHLLNHALGNVSIASMEQMLLVQKTVWQSVPGTALLWGSLVIHPSLGLWSLYARRAVGWTRRDITQLVFGLAIPALLANHLTVTRGALWLYGRDKGYEQELLALGIASPLMGWIQVSVLVVAWVHACIGLEAAIALRFWSPRALGWWRAGTVLIPSLALLGFLQGVRAIEVTMADPAGRARVLAVDRAGTPAEAASLAHLRDASLAAYAGLIAAILLARRLRDWHAARGRTVTIAYPDGRVSRIARGMSVLDASRRIGYRHASVCGGRGRCSTCRVSVAEPAPPAPGHGEAGVLAMIGANPTSVRLACQYRPEADLRVLPLVPPELAAFYVLGRGAAGLGEERHVVAMFIDLRGSTALAATAPPYDAVFLVHRFVAEAAASVTEAGGMANVFTGDGLLALFGLDCAAQMASARALRAASLFARRLARLNEVLASQQRPPLAAGIGIHGGEAVVGEVGFRGARSFTALGDPVNVAARLQEMSKRYETDLIVSAAVVGLAGADWHWARRERVVLRGREGAIEVAMARLDALAARG